MLQRLKAFWKDDRGQATTEYILVMAVVVMIASKLRGIMTTRMKRVTDALFKNIDDAMQTTGASNGNG